ncbi:MAG TPA: hypothetical protein VNV88_01720, partial [Candidatus Solibacter sp.]|nr:hypothetical protein [Candidatus Solibacter sp.]
MRRSIAMYNWLISVPASAKKDRSIALGVVVLVGMALFAAIAFPAGAALPAVNPPTRGGKAALVPARTAGMLRSSSPARQSAQHSGGSIRLAEPRSITPNYVGADGAASSLSPDVELPGQGRDVELPSQDGGVARSIRRLGVARPSQDRGPGEQAVPPTRILSSRQARALSLVSADFNGDGIADLAAGYAAPHGGGIIAVHYGSLDAFAPQSDAAFQAIGRGEFPASFLPEARVFSVPVAPDLLAVGNLTGSGTNDLVVAARGASVLYVLPGDGHGSFRAPQVVNLAGGVTAIGGGRLDRTSPSSDLIVGISSPDGPSLLVYRGASKGPKLLAHYSLGGPVSSIAFGNLTAGAGADAAVVADGDLFILSSTSSSSSSSASSSSMQLERVTLPITAAAVALGSFVYDREGRMQMALLSPDGSVHLVVRSGIDSRPLTPQERTAVFLAAARGLPDPVVPAPDPKEGWKILESFSVGTPGPLPVMFRT